MNSITEDEAKSNIFAWQKHKKMAVLVARHLRAAGNGATVTEDSMTRRAALMANCADRVFYNVHEDGSLTYGGTWLCRDRLCPVCAWRLSIKRLGEMMETVKVLAEKEPETKAIHVTLTVRNCAVDELRAVIKQISEGFARLRRRRLWTDYIRGYMRSIEVTFNAETGEYHPHIHVIAIVPGTYTRQINIGDWVDMWRDCCRLDYKPIVYARHAYKRPPTLDEPTFAVYEIERAGEITPAMSDEWGRTAAADAIREAMKYPVKPDALPAVALSGEIREFAEAISGVRLVAFGGIIKAIRAELGYTDHDEPTEAPETTIDPNAGIERYALVYAWIGHLGRYEARMMRLTDAVQKGDM